MTPKEIVAELDKYIVGQQGAKRAVAIALRNRWRRQQVSSDLREEISPKNIIMIGATGVGKTEIARRLAKLAQAPFVKVEASKFTEVGYVGRDVDSIVRDLVEASVSLVKKEEEERVATKAEQMAKEKVLEKILSEETAVAKPMAPYELPDPNAKLPNMDELRKRLDAGEFDDRYVEMEVPDTAMPMVEVFNMAGLDEVNLKDMFQSMPGFRGRKKSRKLKVKEALEIYQSMESEKLIDMDAVQHEGRVRAEQSGIVFIDEIDKVVAKSRGGSGQGPDVSREGVQRDLLPLVEGSTVNTKYGPVKTDHMLFIAAGAFHVSKPSDMVPELQGRFPIRVELNSLGAAEFVRILTEPKNALIKQYMALMKTENVTLEFKEDSIKALAEMAASANSALENIGARRLHTIMEKLLDEISFSASEMSGQHVQIDADKVKRALSDVLKNEDLSRFVL
ncbi:MAG: ATP-dependent protease ATPase subunit HslU [Deltaproteobacteria bacterium]|nr:ATP-dependent protease ATPase subunit HslU [Deltaproteobacteria bacterium]MBN2673131.1 ATP-dependent protease ATPase subunit HslU [Deltaproteobacteria bacterium]